MFHASLNVSISKLWHALKTQLNIFSFFTLGASLGMQINSSGNNFAGEKYNLTCTVVINGSSSKIPNISWNSTIPAELISHDNGTYMSILQFDPLQESHHDHYQCSVAVADIVDEESFYLNVQGKFLSIIKWSTQCPSSYHINNIMMQYQWFMLLSMEVKVLQL